MTILIFFILLVTILIQGISNRYLPNPDIYIYEQKWLIDQISQTKKNIDNADGDSKEDILKIEAEKYKWMDVFITPKSSFSDMQRKLPDVLINFQNELLTSLNINHPPIINAIHPYHDIDSPTEVLTAIVKEFPLRVVDEEEEKGEGGVVVTAEFSISVPLSNGDWITFKTKEADFAMKAFMLHLVSPIAGIIIILLASVLTARSLLKPLQKLSTAAEILGRERSTVEIPEMVIPEYKNIADAFSKMQIQLKRYVDNRTHMLAAISHDLRTLLTRMRLAVEDVNDETKREHILQNLADMETMINEYLVFARDDAKKERYIRMDIVSLVLSICDTMDDEGYNITYYGADHAMLVCQPVGMRRVFTNILMNGCRYGDEVIVSMVAKENFITFTVQDKGPGIPEHLIEQAFLPFKRLDTSRNRDIGGTGLGLAIAKDIIHAHGGEIHLKNASEGGLVVTITLPKPEETKEG